MTEKSIFREALHKKQYLGENCLKRGEGAWTVYRFKKGAWWKRGVLLLREGWYTNAHYVAFTLWRFALVENFLVKLSLTKVNHWNPFLIKIFCPWCDPYCKNSTSFPCWHAHIYCTQFYRENESSFFIYMHGKIVCCFFLGKLKYFVK